MLTPSPGGEFGRYESVEKTAMNLFTAQGKIKLPTHVSTRQESSA
jgi:hypothetical protein